jgi:adenosylmethionine-8-amino-7-oxononanoate aminotransferase
MSELKAWSFSETNKYVNRNAGYWVDYKNKLNLDINCGNSAFILGYHNEKILDAMNRPQVSFLRGNSGETCEENEYLIEHLLHHSGMSALNWSISGSDAVEAAIAMNDQYWKIKDKNKPRIISFIPCYHGTTMLTKHLRGEYDYLNRASLCNGVSWRDISEREEQEENALNHIRYMLDNDDTIGCIIMETIPWISQINPWSKNFWTNIRSICDEYGILMIVDDVALCFGKNGDWFGYTKYDVKPDIVAIGKSLTAGYSPLGAALCNSKVYDILKREDWTHGHTWQPNMQGVYAAIETINQIEPRLYKVDSIHKQFVDMANELSLDYAGESLFVQLNTPKTYTLKELHDVGLTANIIGYKSIKIILPLIADEEYFGTLKEYLKRLL